MSETRTSVDDPRRRIRRREIRCKVLSCRRVIAVVETWPGWRRKVTPAGAGGIASPPEGHPYDSGHMWVACGRHQSAPIRISLR